MREESGFFSSEEIGRTVCYDGRFHDFRLIYSSSRGFTRVFLAKKQGRNFVIKTLREEYRKDTLALAALRKEYDSGFAVDSRFVVRTIDFVEIPDYGVSIVMEYCPGRSLADLIDSNSRITESDARHIVSGLAMALADIHASGIIHRDIKPQNIIYSSRTRMLKVIDFGCADSENFYLLHGASGTERYTPPERRESESESDSYNDIYAAGLTLSELALVAPEPQARALEAVAAEMTGGRLTEPSGIIEFYDRSLKKRSRQMLLYVIAAVLTCVIILAIWFGKTAPDMVSVSEEPLTAVDSAEISSAVPVDSASESVNIDKEPAEQSMMAVAVEKPKNITADAVKASDSLSSKYPPDKINEYGVSRNEARYVDIWRKKDLDRYIIRTADSRLEQLYRTIKLPDTDNAARKQAERSFKSLDSLSAYVMAEASLHFEGNFDRRRAMGLIKERYILWEEGYRPKLLRYILNDFEK